jgi:hypothetical protein
LPSSPTRPCNYDSRKKKKKKMMRQGQISCHVWQPFAEPVFYLFIYLFINLF